MSPEVQRPAKMAAMLHGIPVNHTRAAGSNAPLRLDDPATSWLVVSGAMNVFAVPMHDGVADGAREFLFRVEAGAMLFGFAAAPDAVLVIIAVGDVDTVVAPVSRADVDLALDDDPSRVLAHVETYAQRLHEALVVDTSADSTDDDSLLALVCAPELSLPGALWPALAAVQREAMRRASFRLQATDLARKTRVQARRTADSTAAARAFGTITGLLTPGATNGAVTTGSTVHDALQRIGREVGVSFRMPAYELRAADTAEQARQVALLSSVGCRQVRLEAGWWHHDVGPLLAFDVGVGHADTQHPVVLLPKQRGYDAVDPVNGTRTPVTADSAARLASHALQFYRGLPDTPVTAGDLWRFVTVGLRSDTRALLLGALGAALLGLLPPLLTGALFGTIIPAADRSGLVTVLLALLVSGVAGLLFESSRAVAMLRMQTRIVHDLQLAVMDRLLRLPVRFFSAFASGDLGRRALGVTTIGDAFGTATITTLLGGVAGSTALVLLFWYSVPLALLSCLMLSLTIGSSLFVARRSMPHARARQQVTGALSALMLETMRGMAKLRVASAESRIFARWSVLFRAQQESALTLGVLSVHLGSFLSVLDVVARLATFAAYAWLLDATDTPLSTGAFVAFAAAEGTVRAASLAMSSTVISLLEMIPVWERARPLLQAVPETHAALPDPGVLHGDIEISRVHYAYEPGGTNVLDDVSISVPAGSFVALVGPSGSGKSTLLRLLLGFDVPRKGTIRFDGQDLQLVDRIAVRRQVGVVLQNATLSQGDIYSNITGSTPRAQSVVWEAARMAGVEDDIRAMPMGLQTLIPDGGSSLSGGQRQRLLIARALINRPRILFFDEATSALDTRAQRCVSESVATLQATRVVVAHRLSTIRHADRIVVLDKGRVVDSGTYEELIARDGLFARMAAQQEA
jgi:ATP-binding cassette subfamily C protein